jgi:hypothetical protein
MTNIIIETLWVAGVATDPSMNENQLRIFMLIVSKYMCDGSLLRKTICLPQRQSAEHLGISPDEYTSEINMLDKGA